MYKSTQEVKLGSDFATICFCVYICLKVHQTILMYSPSLSAWFPLNMPFKCDFPSVAVPFRYFFSGSACRIYSLASSFLQNSPYKCFLVQLHLTYFPPKRSLIQCWLSNVPSFTVSCTVVPITMHPPLSSP